MFLIKNILLTLTLILLKEVSSSSNTYLTVNSKTYEIELDYNNQVAYEFAKLLPLTLEMSGSVAHEKYFKFEGNQFTTNVYYPNKIKAGDIMLYKDNVLVLFYEDFETDFAYTRIGRIKNPGDLTEILGGVNVYLEFYKCDPEEESCSYDEIKSEDKVKYFNLLTAKIFKFFLLILL